MKTLVLIGGGGHCKSVIEAAESVNYKILGILDIPQKLGEDVLGYKIIGTDDDIPNYADNAEFIITVGQIKSSVIRHIIAERVKKAGGKFATIIACDAYVSKHAEISEGTVVLHKAFVNAGAKVGCNCIINTMVNIEHDARIGDFCHISTGTMVNGEAVIGQDCFVGSGSTVYNGVSICDETIIAAASVVNRSLTHPGIYAGNPVKFIK